MIRTLEHLGPLRGKRVLLRCNFDVSVHDGKVLPEATWRLDASAPFLKELSALGARTMVLSHRGRPGGKRDMAYSLRPIFDYFAHSFEASLFFEARDPSEGEIVFLENMRFDPGEEANNPTFAESLSRLGDVYINNDFATAHRAHASVVGIPQFLPSAAGPLLLAEIETLREVRDFTGTGLVVAFGGAKSETKMRLVSYFLPRAGAVLIGGVLANTLLRAQGYSVGASVVDEESDLSGIPLDDPRLILPIDIVVSRSFERAEETTTRAVDPLEKKLLDDAEIIVDIGPQTRKRFIEKLAGAQLIVWNGPLGFVEIVSCREGTRYFARGVLAAPAKTVVGGGDIVSFLAEEKMLSGINHVSTGGGSMLAFLAGETLPGLQALSL